MCVNSHPLRARNLSWLCMPGGVGSIEVQQLKQPTQRCPMRRGVTFIETLVLTGILTALMGTILPAIERAREKAFKAEGLNNLKKIGVAAHGFANHHNGWLPSISGAG